jgi:hypothetical protein
MEAPIGAPAVQLAIQPHREEPSSLEFLRNDY